MISLFDRRLLIRTTDTAMQLHVRTILDERNIEHTIRVRNRLSPTLFSSGSRSRSGSLGLAQVRSFEYSIYVHKSDLSLAQAALRGQPR